MANFDFNLNLDRMMERAYNIPNFGDRIQVAIDNGIQELSERLEQKLRENLELYGLGNSELYNTISTTIEDNGIVLSVGTDYAIYVEYGTGIVGQENSHPNPSIDGWEYDINNHGNEGWRYQAKDGNFYWTKGMPSRPFMYNTWLWGSRSANNIINKHITRELRKLESELK